MIRTKSGAAALSIASNALLIALKLAAGAITGSIAIITEAVHSLIDLVASVVAFFSVRKADEPADAEHPYGHEKVENLAAAIEGMLILVGAGVIIYEATHQLVSRRRGRPARRRHRRDGLLGRRQPRRLHRPLAPGEGARIAGAGGRRRAPAHRRDDLGRGAVRPRPGRRSPATPPSTRSRRWSSPWRSSGPGFRILRRSSGVLVDEALPEAEMDRIEAAIAAARTPEVAGYHKLRARRAGSRRHIDFHVQYRSGTSLERAHELAHQMRDSIEAEIPQAEVLIHAEPETSFREPDDSDSGPFRSG